MLKWTGERYLPYVKPNTCGAEIHYEHLHRYAFVSQFVSSKKVLDLACGEGYGSYMLSKEADYVTGIDIDYKTVEHATHKYQAENLEFFQGSICKIPIEGEKIYDVIVSFEAIEHIDEQENFLEEVKRLLKNDGLFIVSSPNKTLYSDEPGYQNQYHKKELYFYEFESLLKNYFSNVSFFGQKVYCGSNIWELTSQGISKSVNFTIEKEKEMFTFVENNSKNPLYYIAVASNEKTREFENLSSYLVDKSDILLKQGLTYIKELEKGISEHENIIHELKRESSESENVIHELKQKAAEDENVIRELKKEATEHENIIHELKKEAIELENINYELKKSVSDYEYKVKEFNEQISHLNRKSRELENEIIEMRRSILFQLAMNFHRGFVERVFPANTRRRQRYDTALQNGRILANEKLKNLWDETPKDDKQKRKINESTEEEKEKSMKLNEIGIEIDLCEDSEKSTFPELAIKYIRGKGIQIGPTNEQLTIPNNAFITHIDIFDISCLNNKNSGENRLSHSEYTNVKLHPFDKIQYLEESECKILDFVIVNDVIEQLENPEKVLNECFKILKPGGILYIIASDRRYTKSDEKADLPGNIKIENLDISTANYQSGKFVVENILDQLRSKDPDLLNVIDYIDDEMDGKKLHSFVVEKNHFVKKIFECLEAKKIDQPNDIELDVIVPVYNAYEDLIRCLQSLLIHQEDYRIILINDKSTDPKIKDLFLKLKPFETKNLVLLENSENQGFVKTVNRGMKFSKNDVILLNSDTIVTKNWTRKLRECASTDEKIGTITPFTNNGTICSIPNFCEANEVPGGFSVESFADFIEQISFKKYPEIPTAVGFCMYIKREVLNKIGYFDEEAFGKGYGEENEFCMRAIYAGYKNVLCDDTFIFHRGEASFSASKAELLKRNLDILSKRYPEYLPAVHEFIQFNPLKDLHENIQLRMSTWDTFKKRIMYILHSWGGGTEKHVCDLVKKLNKKYHLYILQVIEKDIVLTEIVNGHTLKYIFSMTSSMKKIEFHNEEYSEIVSNIIDTFQIDFIHVHHLIDHSFDVFNIAEVRNIPIIFSIHDYYSVCPRINLLDNKLEYCHQANNINRCSNCLRESGLSSDFINKWRYNFYNVFEKTNVIIAPTNSVFEIMEKYYQNINEKFTVIEHGYDKELLIKTNKKTKNNLYGIFHIATIGALSQSKGREIVYKLANSTELKGKTGWSIFGISDLHSKPGFYQDLNIKIHGKFKDFNELKKLVLENEVNLIILPAIWPETFSYTLSESWALGIPVLVTNLGALEERVNKYGGGWVVDPNIEKISSKLLEIMSNPEEYNIKVNEIVNMELKDLDSMAQEYERLYNIHLRFLRPEFESRRVFSKYDVYSSILKDKNNESDFGNNNIGSNHKNKTLCKRFSLCLKENGLWYTVKKVYTYILN